MPLVSNGFKIRKRHSVGLSLVEGIKIGLRRRKKVIACSFVDFYMTILDLIRDVLLVLDDRRLSPKIGEDGDCNNPK